MVFALLLIGETPDYAKTVQALETAYRAAPLPEILLSIAATYEVWPGHCKEAIATYSYFFEVCEGCAELPRAIDRFDLALERCVPSSEEEAALREQYQVPVQRRSVRRPADATRSEIIGLLDRGRPIDPHAANRTFIALIEAGELAPIDRLNALREEAWSILLSANADAEQTLSLIARLKEVDLEDYRSVLDAMVEAERINDPSALNDARALAIEVLRSNVSPPAPVKPSQFGCAANPAYELGYITIDSRPWSEVSVNGEKIGSTPISKYKVIAGCATVRAISPVNGRERIFNITVRPNRTERVNLDLTR
jgi:hypothetical protein